ncbi:hypothetical protein KR51_00024990, partial [Rubidibacter lacunae KORDI 51-2]
MFYRKAAIAPSSFGQGGMGAAGEWLDAGRLTDLLAKRAQNCRPWNARTSIASAPLLPKEVSCAEHLLPEPSL